MYVQQPTFKNGGGKRNRLIAGHKELPHALRLKRPTSCKVARFLPPKPTLAPHFDSLMTLLQEQPRVTPTKTRL